MSVCVSPGNRTVESPPQTSVCVDAPSHQPASISHYCADHKESLCREFGLTPSDLEQKRDGLEQTLLKDGFPVAEVARPATLVGNFLREGSRFVGTAVLKSSSSGAVSMEWRSSSEGLAPLSEGSHYFVEESERGAIQRFLTPQNVEELAELHRFVRSTLPHEFAETGCNERCLWIASLLQAAQEGQVSKVKVWSRDGQSALQLTPSVFPPSVHWLMHTAPVVKLPSGEEFVLDVALPAPILLEDWLHHLGREQGPALTIAREERWDVPCAPSGGVDLPKESFPELCKLLRAFYLFEMVDGNAPTKKWNDWYEGEAGFAPVQPVEALEKRVVQTVFRVWKAETGEVQTKSRELPLLSNCRQHGGQYFTESAWLKYQELVGACA